MCAGCNGKSALVHVLSACDRVNLLKDHQSRELSQAVASPDAWCVDWDKLFVIGICTHLKTDSLVFEGGFAWVESEKPVQHWALLLPPPLSQAHVS